MIFYPVEKTFSSRRLISLCFESRYLKLGQRLLIWILLLHTVVFAQEITDVHIIKNREKFLIGDLIPLEIHVKHAVGEQYKIKLDTLGLGFFELLGQPQITTHSFDGQQAETKITLTLIPFTTGKVPIPPLLLVNKDESQVLHTPPMEVNVEALSSPQERQIKDVSLLPAVLVNGWLQPVIWTMVLACAALYGGIRLIDTKAIPWLMARLGQLHRPVNKPALPIEQVSSTLEDEMIAKLRALLASELASSDCKRFHIQLADIMAHYAIIRYGMVEQKYTTGELFKLFEAKGVPALVVSTFEQILVTCDLVKFAREQVSATGAQRSARQAIDLFKALNFNKQEKEE